MDVGSCIFVNAGVMLAGAAQRGHECVWVVGEAIGCLRGPDYGDDVELWLKGAVELPEHAVGHPYHAAHFLAVDGLEGVDKIGGAGLDFDEYEACAFLGHNVDFFVTLMKVGVAYGVALRYEVFAGQLLAPLSELVVLCHLVGYELLDVVLELFACGACHAQFTYLLAIFEAEDSGD